MPSSLRVHKKKALTNCESLRNWYEIHCLSRFCEFWNPKPHEFITTKEHCTPCEIAEQAVLIKRQSHCIGLNKSRQRLRIDRTFGEHPHGAIGHEEEQRRTT